jgi:type IV pilus assembly protein PilE
MSMRRDEHGFSLMELLLVLALVSVIVAMAVTAWRHNQLAAGRQQAWLQLHHIGLQQEIWHLQYGHYLTDITSVTPALDTLRYSYQIHITKRGFTLLATTNVDGPKSHDTRCSQLSLSNTGEVKSLGKGDEIQACR